MEECPSTARTPCDVRPDVTLLIAFPTSPWWISAHYLSLSLHALYSLVVLNRIALVNEYNEIMATQSVEFCSAPDKIIILYIQTPSESHN